jgi:hypothetical protein
MRISLSYPMGWLPGVTLVFHTLDKTILFHFLHSGITGFWDFFGVRLTGFSKISSTIIKLSDSTFRERAGTHPDLSGEGLILVD